MIFVISTAANLGGLLAQSYCTYKKVSKAKTAVTVAKATLTTAGITTAYCLNEKRKQSL